MTKQESEKDDEALLTYSIEFDDTGDRYIIRHKGVIVKTALTPELHLTGKETPEEFAAKARQLILEYYRGRH